MTPIYQRLIDNTKGDCMQAAIASLFDLKYEDTPAFIEYPNGFIEPLLTLLHGLGYEYHGMLHNSLDKAKLIPKYSLAALEVHEGVNGFFYASVISPKYFNPDKPLELQVTHAVLIDKDYNIVHDPNPGYIGLKQYPMAEELGYNGVLTVVLIRKKRVREKDIKALFFNAFAAGYANPQLKADKLIPFFDEWFASNSDAILQKLKDFNETGKI